MNIFLDTEFNGFGGELLSMGLIADDDKFFYEHLECSEPVVPWVQENVLPYIKSTLQFASMPQYAVEFEIFQERLETFLNQYKKITIVVDWPDDIKHFCEALITGPGTRIALPEIDFKLDLSLEAGEHSDIQHHALSDAAANRYVYNYKKN